MKNVNVLLCLAAISGAGAAQAQTSLGALLDQGARKVLPAEATTLAPLGLIRQAADSDTIVMLHPNGAVVGTVSNKQGHGSSEARGTWRMDANGQRCVDVDLPAFNMNWKQCGYTYRLGEQLFATASDSDRNAIVTAYVATAHLTP